MNWATAIPLVTLLGVVFTAGVAWAKLSSVEKALGEVRHDMKESAKSQGERIGRIEDRTAVLEDFKTRAETREEARRELSEAHGIVQR